MSIKSRNKWATWTTMAFILVSPLENIYKIEQIYYILAIGVLAFLLLISQKGASLRNAPNPTKPLLFYMIYATMSTLWSMNENALSGMVVFYAVFIFILLQSAFYYDEKNLRQIKIGFILQAVVTIYVCYTHGEVVDNRFWIKSDESGADPNYLAGWFLIPMSFIGEFFFKKGTKLLYRTVMLIIILNIFYFVMASGSRAGLATCTICLLSPFLVVLKNNVKRNPFYSVITIGGLLGTLYLISNNMSDVMSSRVEETQSMGARGIIWNDLMDALYAKPITMIFGYGQYSTTFLNRVHNAAHNTYLDLLVDTGIIGLLPMLLFIFRGVKAAFKCKEYEFVILALSMCTLVFSLTALTTRFFTSFLFLMAVAQKQFCNNWGNEKK